MHNERPRCEWSVGAKFAVHFAIHLTISKHNDAKENDQSVCNWNADDSAIYICIPQADAINLLLFTVLIGHWQVCWRSWNDHSIEVYTPS